MTRSRLRLLLGLRLLVLLLLGWLLLLPRLLLLLPRLLLLGSSRASLLFFSYCSTG
jgi:hypothetical protein